MFKLLLVLVSVFLASNSFAGGGAPPACGGSRPENTTTDHYWNAFSMSNSVANHDKKLRMFDGIPDATRIRQISILGTHDSGAVFSKSPWGWFVKNWAVTQTLNITNQLELGVRFFDLRLSNAEKIVHGYEFDYQYKDIIAEMKNFISNNKTEFILIQTRFPDSSGAYTPNPELEKKLADLDARYGIRLLTVDEMVRVRYSDVKGKIFRIPNVDPDKVIHYQNMHSIKALDEIYDKFVLAADWANYANLKLAVTGVNANDNKFWINYLSANGFYPVTIAGGVNGIDAKNRHPRLATGRIDSACVRDRRAETHYPRWACTSGPLWACTIYYAGVNEMFARHVYETQNLRYLGVIMADFPGPKLAEAVRLANSRADKSCSWSWGSTLGGSWNFHNSAGHPC